VKARVRATYAALTANKNHDQRCGFTPLHQLGWRFDRSIVRLLFAVVLLVQPVSAWAQDTPLDQVRLQTAGQLFQYPENRPLRFRLAKISYHSSDFRAAKFHLKELMRTSPSPDDLQLLNRVYATVLKKSPLSFGFNFAILPSSNIERTSSNQSFDTLAGTFRIVGGGQEKSGVGYRLGASLGYETALNGGASTLTYSAALNRNLFPVKRLSNVEAYVGLTWSKQFIGGVTKISPYLVRTVFDDSTAQGASSARIGFQASYEHYLNGSSSITGTIQAEDRQFDQLTYLDGPFFNLGVSYSSAILKASVFEAALNASLSEPNAKHLAYQGVSLSAELSTRFPSIGTVGFNANSGLREYQGNFPGLLEARQDSFATIGISFAPPKFKIRNTIPRISCEIEQTWSNIALYDIRSKDCSISFQRAF
jgi:hypothetical protein